MDITTRSFDFARSGANTSETTFTPAAVKTLGIRILRALTTPDDPRLEAQPLYLSQLDIGGTAHNVVYQGTMGNTVYAWDADTGALIWRTNLGTPITGSTAIDEHLINVKWGILSTPVIDRAAGVLYCCAWISMDKSGTTNSGHHFVSALDIRTGQQVKPLLDLEGVVFDPGHGVQQQQFKSIERKQRSALALVNGAVIICFGTIQETAKQARGWVIAVDTAQWQVSAQWCSTARGDGGGIWMSGAGPAIQSDGSIWFTTGNGDFDGVTDFSESVVKLRYTPPAPGAAGSLTVAGTWTPWTDSGRTGGNPQGEAAAVARAAIAKAPKASNFRIVPHLARMGIAPEAMGDGWSDQDIAACGIVLIEDQGVALVSSKDGVLYTIKLADPGDTTEANLSQAATPANYAKLAAPPILYTFFDPAVPPAPANPEALNQLAGGVTHHLHGTPVAWISAAHGQMHFCGGENGNLRAWQLNQNNTSGYLGCSSAYASAQAAVPPGGMPGWSISLSANGQNDGLVFGIIPYGDANMALTNGRLLVYDAANLGAFQGGSGELVPLWDSQDWNWGFLHPKFNRPVVADGKLFMPTYDGRLLVIGLA